MLTLVTGKTGSGKSYFTVKKILEIISYSKVITNVKINIEHPNYSYYDEEKIKEYLNLIRIDFANVDSFTSLVDKYKNHDLYGGATFFIDECHLLGFRKYEDALSNWLSVHRHFNQDIYLITQTTDKIHRSFLPEFQFWYRLIPSNKNITKDMMGYKKYDDVPTKALLETKYFKPDLDLFELYETGKNDSASNPMVKRFVLILLLLVSVVGALSYIISSGFLLPKYTETNSTNDIISENNNTISNTQVIEDTVLHCTTTHSKPTEYIYLEQITPFEWKYCFLIKTYKRVKIENDNIDDEEQRTARGDISDEK